MILFLHPRNVEEVVVSLMLACIKCRSPLPGHVWIFISTKRMILAGWHSMLKVVICLKKMQQVVVLAIH
jgi:hypothetical protein